MKQHTTHLTLRTDGRGLIDFTAMVESWLAGRAVVTGVLTVFCVHTSASLLIQENAAPEVRSDLIAFFDRIVPENHGSMRMTMRVGRYAGAYSLGAYAGKPVDPGGGRPPWVGNLASDLSLRTSSPTA
jgi:hypothetical protein